MYILQMARRMGESNPLDIVEARQKFIPISGGKQELEKSEMKVECFLCRSNLYHSIFSDPDLHGAPWRLTVKCL